MKKVGFALVIVTALLCIFACGFLIGRNANSSTITVRDPSVTTTNSTVTSQKININTASVEELTLLPGIGHKLANRIIDYRSNIGPFRTISDLTNVEGIGDEKFMKLMDYITI